MPASVASYTWDQQILLLQRTQSLPQGLQTHHHPDPAPSNECRHTLTLIDVLKFQCRHTYTDVLKFQCRHTYTDVLKFQCRHTYTDVLKFQSMYS